MKHRQRDLTHVLHRPVETAGVQQTLKTGISPLSDRLLSARS